MITVFASINMDLVAFASKIPRPGETVAGLQSSASPGALLLEQNDEGAVQRYRYLPLETIAAMS